MIDLLSGALGALVVFVLKERGQVAVDLTDPTILAGIIGGAATILAAIISIFALRVKRRPAVLSLVDLLIVPTTEAPKIEFKLRNNSDEVAFLKRAVFTQIAHWELPQPGVIPHAEPVSATYDVDLSEENPSVNLSQVVEPNAVDRFEFRMGSTGDTPFFLGLSLYLFEIDLIYNEDNRTLKSPKILLHTAPHWAVMTFYQRPIARQEAAVNKSRAIELLSSIDKTVVSEPGLIDKIRRWAEVDLSQFPLVVDIGGRITEERVRQGLSQEELAKKAGFKSKAGISRIERRLVKPRDVTLKRIADALNVDVTTLTEPKGTERRSWWRRIFGA